MKTKHVFGILIFVLMVVFVASNVEAVPTSPASQGEQAPQAPGEVVLPEAVALSQPVATLMVTNMVLGNNAFEQYGCKTVSSDATKCLDGPNQPVSFTHDSIYGAPSPSISVSSVDLGNGAFQVTVQGKKEVATYGSCIVADVLFQEVWLEANVVYNSHLQATTCFLDNIWYFSYHL